MEGGFTLHIGRQGELSKPQILRSEWVSGRSNAFVEQAGHPHWQIDVLETIRVGAPDAPVRFDAPEAEPAAREFGSEAAAVSAESLLIGLTVERMHLASAALWWRQPSVSVAHVPSTVADLDRWILGCVAYLRREAQRCAILETPN